MRSFNITDTHLFMNALLNGDVFSSFLVCSVRITTFACFMIDGEYMPSYDEGSPESGALTMNESEISKQHTFVRWMRLQDKVRHIVAGSNVPLQMKLVLMLDDEHKKRCLELSGARTDPSDVTGLYLNILYEDKKLTCTTGISLSFFTTDRTIEHSWDDLVGRLFRKHGIAVQTEI